MEKRTDDLKKHLKEQYEKACNGYKDAMLAMWELDDYNGWWVSDETGGTYCYGDTHSFTMDEIVYIVENDIEENEVLRWEDYLLSAHEFGFDLPTLTAWHSGYQPIPEETFERLRGMKRDLMDEVERVRNLQEDNNPGF